MNARSLALRLAAVSSAALLGAGMLAGCAQSAPEESLPSEDTMAIPEYTSPATANEDYMYTLYVGLIDASTGTQVLSMDDAAALATPLVTELSGGYTLIRADGGFTNDEGVVVDNDTLVYDGIVVDSESIASLVDDIKSTLNLESVLVVRRYVGYELYGGHMG